MLALSIIEFKLSTVRSKAPSLRSTEIPANQIEVHSVSMRLVRYVFEQLWVLVMVLFSLCVVAAEQNMLTITTLGMGTSSVRLQLYITEATGGGSRFCVGTYQHCDQDSLCETY